MWGKRYFSKRYWAGRFFPPVLPTVTPPDVERLPVSVEIWPTGPSASVEAVAPVEAVVTTVIPASTLLYPESLSVAIWSPAPVIQRVSLSAVTATIERVEDEPVEAPSIVRVSEAATLAVSVTRVGPTAEISPDDASATIASVEEPHTLVLS